MITEQGTVTNADASIAWIKTIRSSACKACEARSSCETVKNQKEMHVKVNNTLNVQKGDQVVIGLETKPLLFLTFLLYVFPVIMLITGAVIGNIAAPIFSIDSSLCSIFSGFLLFFIAFFILRKKNKTLSRQPQYKPFLVRKKSSVQLNTCPTESN